MSAPISNFGFSRNNLNVDFKNLSLNLLADTIYLWDFGNGSTSTLKDPSTSYSDAGFFSVTLTVTSTNEPPSTISMSIGVGSLVSVMNTPILSLIYYYLPSTLLSNNQQLVTYIQSWQVYLQPLMEYPLVTAQDTHNELQWGAIANKLIAMLVAKDIIISESSAFLANIIKEGSLATSSSTDGTAKPRSIKTIETGPARTEWFEGNAETSNSETLKNIGAGYKNLTAPGGVLNNLEASICGLSKYLMIYLPECGKLVNPIIPFKMGSSPKVGSILNTTIPQDPWELFITL
jgi:PKD repeat protein